MGLSNTKPRLAAAALLLVWCLGLLTYRLWRAPEYPEYGMLWNLFLAALPLLWSSGFQVASQRKRPILAGLYFGLWLLFLPNAPYILTDLTHLGPRPHLGVWFILALLLSCAATGTMLCYISLISVHAVVEQKFGRLLGWGVATGSLFLCGFGMYLGRYMRFNSWDILTKPAEMLQSIGGKFVEDPGPLPHPLAMTMVYGVALTIGYLVLRLVAISLRSD